MFELSGRRQEVQLVRSSKSSRRHDILAGI